MRFQDIQNLLNPILSRRFLKFCSVGASGVIVNLAFLAFFADALQLQTNIASALAIEISIISNFIINEWWTFKDRRRESGSLVKRAMQFNLVSIIGGLIQWTVFVAMNLMWQLMLQTDSDPLIQSGGSLLDRYFFQPILHPADVGMLKYCSQLFGIGIATFWNFLANFHWTWSKDSSTGAQK